MTWRRDARRGLDTKDNTFCHTKVVFSSTFLNLKGNRCAILCTYVSRYLLTYWWMPTFWNNRGFALAIWSWPFYLNCFYFFNFCPRVTITLKKITHFGDSFGWMSVLILSNLHKRMSVFGQAASDLSESALFLHFITKLFEYLRAGCLRRKCVFCRGIFPLNSKRCQNVKIFTEHFSHTSGLNLLHFEALMKYVH